MRGHYGNYHITEKTRGSRLWISPLMPLYWFFDLTTVARHNLYLPAIAESDTFMEAFQSYMLQCGFMPRRPRASIPLQ